MERRRNVIQNQPPAKCLNCPSFSSTLLDAIYQSIDETDADIRGAAKQQLKPKPTCFAESRRIIPPATIHRRAAVEPSSRLPPIRTGTIPPTRSDRFAASGIDEKRAAKDRQGSIRSYLRDLRSGRSPRLTNFLTSIFAAKSKVSAELPPSCLSKTPSTGRRTVRFCPVSVIVGEDSGEKWVCKKQGMKKSKMEEEEEEEDLFELKNLAFIGRFRDELPVFANVAAFRGG